MGDHQRFCHLQTGYSKFEILVNKFEEQWQDKAAQTRGARRNISDERKYLLGKLSDLEAKDKVLSNYMSLAMPELLQ